MSENEIVNARQQAADSDADKEVEAPQDAAPDTLRVLEALLFASDDLLTAARLKTVLPGGPDARAIRSMVDRINCQLQKERHPFEIVEIGGGYQFKTIAYYHPWVRQIFQEKISRRLSIQALECLSIEAIRGVISDGAMKTLLERRLITVTGRSEKVGRPLLYGTTREFLTYFGLNKISDLPKIEEFEAMVRQKIEDMPTEELKNAQEQAKQDAAEEAALAESIGRSDHETVEVIQPSDSGGGMNIDNSDNIDKQ
jgi:segregation and condensation protein B